MAGQTAPKSLTRAAQNLAFATGMLTEKAWWATRDDTYADKFDDLHRKHAVTDPEYLSGMNKAIRELGDETDAFHSDMTWETAQHIKKLIKEIRRQTGKGSVRKRPAVLNLV